MASTDTETASRTCLHLSVTNRACQLLDIMVGNRILEVIAPTAQVILCHLRLLITH